MAKSIRLAGSTAGAARAETVDISEGNLANLFTKSTPDERKRAVEQLLALNIDELLPRLNFLIDKGTQFYDEVVDIVKQRPDEEALRGIWQRLAETDERDTRQYVLEAASHLDEARVARILPLYLNDPDVLLRRRALTRLGALDQSVACGAALLCLDDADDSVRLQAARILAAFESDQSIGALARLARDTNPDCRSEALQYLQTHAPFDALLAATAIQERYPNDSLDALIVFSQHAPDKLAALIRDGVKKTAKAGKSANPDELGRLLLRLPDDELDRLKLECPVVWLRSALVTRDTLCDDATEHALARLTAACSDSDSGVRAKAIAALARHDEASPGAALARLLTHGLPEVRRRAVELLARHGEKTVALLRRTLQDVDAGVRLTTYDTLAAQSPEDAVAIWEKALRDKDDAIRRTAIARVIELPHSAKAREALAKAARDKDPLVSTPAVCTLAERDVFVREAARSYDAALNELLAVETQPLPKPTLLSQLIKAVSQLQPTGAIETLIAAARYRKSAVIRREAGDALLSKSKKIAHGAMAELIDTEDPDILKRVALTLAHAKDPRALIPLIRAHDECPQFGDTADRLLEDYPQTRQLRFLLKALKMPFISVKRYAARQLIELDSPDMIEPLLLATKDPDVEVQRAAIQALGKYSKRPEVYQRMLEIRDAGGESDVRQQAVAMLLGMDSGSIVGPLIQATREDDMEVQLAAIKALGKYATRPEVYTRLMELVEYGEISVREKAVETLGEFQVKEAIDVLIRYLNNPFLRFRVEEALMRIGDRRGYLAVKRKKIREKLFGKKKTKGPIAPPLRKNKLSKGKGKH